MAFDLHRAQGSAHQDDIPLFYSALDDDDLRIVRACLNLSLEIARTILQEADVLSSFEEDALQRYVERVRNALNEDLDRTTHPRPKLSERGLSARIL